ncbi:hypothetical protein ACOSP7_013683 [Xanthoceras sorbifolium]|uniref:WAT1-related protein n=1 Tax=Xanthoceras sorbifolium TaxID=99658 RepID=A0ABQ8I3T1_9ROSI|nr:hypothetical protein JRO89_XS04G0013400 [Xanthoceras sorbifolium]
MVVLGDFLPFLAMVVVQLGYAGMNITSKLAMDSGMKPLVLVVYRQMIATLAIIPFAYFFEWKKNRPKLTSSILFKIFLCSLTGATGNQVLYFVGLANSTPTIGCALTNILPAVTFVLAVIFRQESLGIKKRSDQAKLLGTVVCVGGAMLLSFYNGHTIGIPDSSIHWNYAQKMSKQSASNNKSNLVFGSIIVMASAVSYSIWVIIQAKVSEKFQAPYTSTALMCSMSTVQCAVIAAITEHKRSEWSLSSPIRLISALYTGIVCSALAFLLISWSIQRKGALYVSVFSPLLLVIVAILSWALLGEKLFVGTAIGSVLIVGGLYAVLWGKDKEMKEDQQIQDIAEPTKKSERTTDDLEKQSNNYARPNNNSNHQAATG